MRLGVGALPNFFSQKYANIVIIIKNSKDNLLPILKFESFIQPMKNMYIFSTLPSQLVVNNVWAAGCLRSVQLLVCTLCTDERSLKTCIIVQ